MYWKTVIPLDNISSEVLKLCCITKNTSRSMKTTWPIFVFYSMRERNESDVFAPIALLLLPVKAIQEGCIGENVDDTL